MMGLSLGLGLTKPKTVTDEGGGGGSPDLVLTLNGVNLQLNGEDLTLGA